VRVYQFRHIRAETKSSHGSPPDFAPGQGYDVVLRRGLIPTLSLLAALSATAPALAAGGRTEVLVTLKAPPLARALAESRVLTSKTKHRRLDLRSPTSAAYLGDLASAQRALAARIAARIPGAHVRWHYRIVLDGFAVVVRTGELHRLSSLPGVAHVYPSARYHSQTAAGPELIGAPFLWGSGLTTAGQGMKIGVIDEGVDQTHPYFNASGFASPPGFPKGNRSYTSAKVIVARAFAPPSPKWRYAGRPFDPVYSEHGTHVAGIAAGDYGIDAAGTQISGVAPKAFIGNYKVLTIPTASNVGLDGNSAEIVAGIEAAVRDGMDVINLSLGEPEIDLKRDIVVKAIDAAADAGVVPAIAAGNDYEAFGRGTVGSPASAPKAITAAAVSYERVVSSFSSAGPTPVSLQMKPDVSAPGEGVLSSVPRRDGTWAEFSGTSMASPHVAGGAALLRQRHPTWTVAEIKSALVQTGLPVYTTSRRSHEALPTREGGGLLNLREADDPLLFARPTGLSFRYLHRGAGATRTVTLADAGGGAGIWSVSVRKRSGGSSASVTAPGSVAVPGSLPVHVAVHAGAAEGEVSGFVVLTRGSRDRRIPFWLRVTAPRLARHKHGTLRNTGTYHGNTAGQAALVTSYRYPDDPRGVGLPTSLRGPEQVFHVQLAKPVANFGVAVLSQAGGTAVQPRVVAAGDENRLTGYAALPLDLNPYRASLYRPILAAGAIRPAAGSYDVVFDSVERRTAGRFTFRFWIGDTKPPTLSLRTRTVGAGERLRLTLHDASSGVDPGSIAATIDGRPVSSGYSRRRGEVVIPLRSAGRLSRGRHRLVVQASDYQESRNMEDVAPILPNTRRLETTFRIR
jgi:subtilisin family serine protease